MDDCESISSLSIIKTSKLKRKASSSVGSPDKPKKFKSNDTSSEYSSTHTFKLPGAQKNSKNRNSSDEHLPTQSKASSHIGSRSTSSVISFSLAYGAHDAYNSDDDAYTTSEAERPNNLMKYDTTLLSRDKGVLFSEDLTDDYEIWTCQCPDDVDIRGLQDNLIHFDEVSMARIKNTMSHKVHLIPYKSEENTKITIVVPSEETNNLSLNVVQLTGKIIMTNQVKKAKSVNPISLPVDTIKDATRRRSELMSKITERLSNKYNIDSVHDTSIKKEIKIEKESPKKVKKSKRK